MRANSFVLRRGITMGSAGVSICDIKAAIVSYHTSLLQHVAICSPATNFEGYSDAQKAWWSKSCNAPWCVYSAFLCLSFASLDDAVLDTCV